MTDKLTKRQSMGDRSTVFLRKSEMYNTLNVSVPIRNSRYSNEIVNFPLDEVAALLGKETLEDMLVRVKRQQRHSGVESLDDIRGGEYPATTDDYHDVLETEPHPERDVEDTVEIKRKHLRKLRQVAQLRSYVPAVREAVRETGQL